MAVMAVTGSGSSPHTRGALDQMVVAELEPLDHPRIRGEHLYEVFCYREIGGSSPHTRGARAL